MHRAVSPLERPHRPDMAGVRLACFYFCWVAALGTFGPFLAGFLALRGMSPRAVTWTLAVVPLVRVLATPAWTYLADRLRAPTLMLRVVCLGAVAAFVAVAKSPTPRALALALMVYTVFRAPVGALSDSVALAWAARTGGSFGRVRALGSFGYLLAAVVLANLLARHGHGLALALTLGLLGAATALTWTLPGAPPRPTGALGYAFRRLLAEPTVRRLLAAGTLQQMGLAPYDALFPTWFLHRAGGAWTGGAIALGVGCEIVVMVWARPWIQRVGVWRALGVAFGASVLRWLVTAFVPVTAVVALAQGLHGLAFGLYFVAAVEALDRVAPDDVRASAQGVHHTVVFGVGTAGALAIAGALGGLASMRAVFVAAAVASALAAWLVAGVDHRPPRQG